MTWPSVTIEQYNTFSSSPDGVENTLLFVGNAQNNKGKVLPVNANSDLDELLGTNASSLKNFLQSALTNAGQNAFFYVAILPEAGKGKEATPACQAWQNAILAAQETVSVEGVVITEPVSTKDDINAIQALRQTIINKYQRRIWFILTIAANDGSKTWADYVAELTTLQKGIAAPQIMLVPEIFGFEPGVLAGRLCNSAVTIADSPARVAPDEEQSNALAEHEKSRRHPDATLNEKGFAQYSNDTDSDAEDRAATSKAVKAAFDNAEKRLRKDENGKDIPDKAAFTRNIGAACAHSGNISIGGDNGNWTTAQFIDWLDTQGAFNHPYWMVRGSWSYASNKIITDTGCGNIQLAGSVVEVMGTRNAMTIRVTTPTTATNGTAKAQFTYINHGDAYTPGWRRDWNRGGDAMTGKLILLQTSGFGVNTDNALGDNSIAFGDNDTGIKQNGDGLLDVYANGQRVFRFQNGALQSNQAVNVTGRVTPSDYGNFDARYQAKTDGVQGIRLGSAIGIGRGGDAPSGHLLSGVDGGESVDWANARPVQVLINGVWRNVASL